VCDTLAGLIGAPGSYKSFLADDWAACTATGTPWCGREVAKGALSPDAAADLLGALASAARVIEVAELAERIEKLEAANERSVSAH